MNKELNALYFTMQFSGNMIFRQCSKQYLMHGMIWSIQQAERYKYNQSNVWLNLDVISTH